MLIITGILLSCCLVAGAVLTGIDWYKSKTYQPVTAIVSSYDTRDGKNVWTELTYSYGGSEYTTRIKGHSYWMKVDSEVEILVKSSSPEQIEIVRNSGNKANVAWITSIPFGIFFLFYLFNYLRVRRT
ncbi:MAG: hypothetical protein ACK5LX_07845 [Oscillospiraceae bacterium]